jgi:hypothetical protein
VKGKNKGVTRGSRREKGLRSVLRKEVKSGTVVSTGVQGLMMFPSPDERDPTVTNLFYSIVLSNVVKYYIVD